MHLPTEGQEERTAQSPRVSVAVPLYNEESNVEELVRRVTLVLDALPGGPHELVLVDDGSIDGTRRLMEQASARDARIVSVFLSRNFGHQPALSAALDHVRGEVVVLMDGDLQDRPEEIPRFVEKFREGNDVVYAKRERRKESMWLRAAYWTYYRMLARVSNISFPLDAGDFGLMSRRVVDEIRRIPERNRYLRGLRVWAGFRQVGVSVERDARYSGESKYSFWRLVALGLDGVFSFSIVPIRAATLLGMGAMGLTLLFVLYAIYARVALDRSPQGFTALLVVIAFVSGVLLFFLGVIGEYVGRIYEEVRGRPIYVVERVVRGDGE
ncbi:MAG: glycosyltransferase family 2 protein [Longimicrobiales bacterium]|nr:glycosyltransferase family 2 protein [Longimicrobiales bacterium]